MSWAFGAMTLKTSMKFSITGEMASIISGNLFLNAANSESVSGNILSSNGISTRKEKYTIYSQQNRETKCFSYTMLQKLSKCEVKVHNTRIYLQLNFAWNHFWQNLNIKNCHFYHFIVWQIWILVNLGLEKWLKFTKNWNSEPLKMPKMTFLTIWIHQNLISRKIRVVGKL